jgi:hypothetical protein
MYGLLSKVNFEKNIENENVINFKLIIITEKKVVILHEWLNE